MIYKKTLGDRAFDAINAALLILLSLICLYPILYVFFASFSEPHRLSIHRGMILKPLGFTLEGYKLVLKNPNIVTGYINTLIYVIVGTAVNIVLTSLGAYVLSRKGMFWGRYLMLMVTFTMFFGGGLIPNYLLMLKLNLVNNRLAMIIPGAISTWNLIVMRTSFLAIPDSLEESAKIDGANDFTVLFRIILPLSKAIIAVMVLFYSVGHWNAWFNAMLYLRKRELFPLQLIIREVLISNEVKDLAGVAGDANGADRDQYKHLVQYCTIVVATLPILCAYPFMQKYFVKGVMIGSVKG